METEIIIDRIEDGLATLAVTLPAKLLPENAREGDALFRDGEGRLQIDEEKTRRLRKHTARLFESLLDKDV